MRTLEEIIKHHEKLAEAAERSAKLHQRPDRGVKGSGKRYLSCIECAAEHRQLAEWLKELKACKDFEDKGYVMCRFEVAQDDRHRTTKMVLDFSTRKLFDNIVEVDADDKS